MERPPETLRNDVIETLHGERVADPYRWLEDGTEDVAEWVDRQNEYADAHLRPRVRDELRPRIRRLVETDEYHTVVQRGGRYFQRVEGETADQPRLFVRDTPDGERRLLADPNEWDGARALNWFVPSPDGDLVAYGVDEGGAEMYDVRVVDVEDGATVDDVADAGRLTGRNFAWTADGGGYHYVATGSADEGAQHEKELRIRTLGGDEQTLFEHDDPREWVHLHADGATGTLVVGTTELSGSTDLYVLDDDELVPALVGADAEFRPTVHDGRICLRTEHGAPNGRVLGGDVATFRDGVDPADLDVVLAERDETLESIAVGDDRIVARYQRGGSESVRVFDGVGSELGTLPLPEFAAVRNESLTVAADGREAFYRVETFTDLPEIHRADLDDLSTAVVDAPSTVAATDLTVKRETVPSTDGADVPVYLVHREGLERDGDNPAVLYGYGGFRISVTSGHASEFVHPFLADGGVYAQVCARGGREFGEPWHEAAVGGGKQHTFDDFLAAAEFLVEAGYVHPDRLAALGGSNGGLTVNAAVTQRPDLFAAAVADVPLTDLLRFHEFLIGEAWISEFGSPEDPDDFDHLRAYSPYHNVESGVEYPPMLLTTAVSDTRVHPSHARKMVARLQADADGGPFLLRTQDDAGHGIGKPTSAVVAEKLDRWAFLYEHLGAEPVS